MKHIKYFIIMVFCLSVLLTGCNNSVNNSDIDNLKSAITSLEEKINDIIENGASPTVTYEMASALEEATNLINNGAYSKSELRSYMKSETDYSVEAVEYAIANIEVDWNAEAIEYAELVVLYSSTSEINLHEILEYVGFEHEHVEYALENIEVDWNQECVDAINEYLEHNSELTQDEIVEQLFNNGFTEEQIKYAVETIFN